MTFTRASAETPTSIGTILITLIDDPVEGQAANYEVFVLDQNGQHMRVQGDIGNLIPHLTPAQITGLQDFMTSMRTKSVTEFLP